jgi:protein TonB
VTPPSEGAMVATKLRVHFLATGHVAAVDVMQSSGIPALDEAAVEAYQQCHFDPSASGQPAFQEEWVTTLSWTG